MKRIYYILILALPLLVLSGCSKFEEDLFGKSSSERVDALIKEAYDTLTSSPEGWYFNYHVGWDELEEIGGYWFWCKFNTDYTVDAALELNTVYYYGNETTHNHPAGDIVSSPFEFIKSRGAVLSFDIYNPILDFFVVPSANAYQGLQGDLEFSISEVTPSRITVKGIKTGKIMHFYKKTDGKETGQAMRDLSEIGNRIDRTSTMIATVAGAYSGEGYEPVAERAIKNYNSHMRASRAITLTYNVLTGMNGETPVTETKEVRMLYTPDMDGKGITLYNKVNVMGNDITAFTYDANTDAFTSNDPGQTVVLKQTDAYAIEDVLGRYTAYVSSYWEGTLDPLENITITRQSGNKLKVQGIDMDILFFYATFDPNLGILVAEDYHEIEGITLGGVKVYFKNPYGGAPTVFYITRPDNVTNISCGDLWGYYAPDYVSPSGNVGAWGGLYGSLRLIHN